MYIFFSAASINTEKELLIHSISIFTFYFLKIFSVFVRLCIFNESSSLTESSRDLNWQPIFQSIPSFLVNTVCLLKTEIAEIGAYFYGPLATAFFLGLALHTGYAQVVSSKYLGGKLCAECWTHLSEAPFFSRNLGSQLSKSWVPWLLYNLFKSQFLITPRFRVVLNQRVSLYRYHSRDTAPPYCTAP